MLLILDFWPSDARKNVADNGSSIKTKVMRETRRTGENPMSRWDAELKFICSAPKNAGR